MPLLSLKPPTVKLRDFKAGDGLVVIHLPLYSARVSDVWSMRWCAALAHPHPSPSIPLSICTNFLPSSPSQPLAMLPPSYPNRPPFPRPHRSPPNPSAAAFVPPPSLPHPADLRQDPSRHLLHFPTSCRSRRQLYEHSKAVPSARDLAGGGDRSTTAAPTPRDGDRLEFRFHLKFISSPSDHSGRRSISVSRLHHSERLCLSAAALSAGKLPWAIESSKRQILHQFTEPQSLPELVSDANAVCTAQCTVAELF